MPLLDRTRSCWRHFLRRTGTEVLGFSAVVLLLLWVASPLNGAIAPERGVPEPTASESLTGKLLVAEPRMGDPRFRQTVIFMIQHNENGALGIVVNRALQPVKFAEVLKSIGADPEDIEGEVQVHYGGPVQPNRGFVLHTTDYQPAMIPVDERYGVTMNAEILKAMARGKGPKLALFVIGYAGWAGGQLEGELERGSWAVAPAQEEILFDGNYDTKWERALKRRFLST